MISGKVVFLSEILDGDESLVGTKAMSLARLMRIKGINVPRGFCITGQAYREFMNTGDMKALIAKYLEGINSQPIEIKRDTLALIRQKIIGSSIQKSLYKDIEKHYLELSPQSVAVRSSATAEDLPGHSFAGQYETYLGIGDLNACVEAIRKCWASLWTERGFEYRAQRGFEHQGADMAVIVQELVEADASGVAFTADPVSGNTDVIIIESCFGMGESLVSGRVTPDRITISKKDFTIVSTTTSDKKIKSVPGEKGLYFENLDPDTRKKASIDEVQAKDIAKMVMKVEQASGTPQDIEWAIRGDEIFLLQSRPITTIPTERPWEERQVWTNLNSGEIFPDVITPMTWSVVEPGALALFDPLVGGVGLDFGKHPLMTQIAGRVYFNLNTIMAMLKNFPPLRKVDVTQLFGGEQDKVVASSQFTIRQEDIPDLKFSLPRMLMKVPGFIHRFISHSHGKGDVFISEIRTRASRILSADLSSFTDNDISEAIEKAMDDLLDFIGAAGLAGFGMLSYFILDAICKRWIKDTDGTCVNRLLAGIGGIDSAEAGLDLWRLARTAHKYPKVEEIIRKSETWNKTREMLTGIHGGPEFMVQWKAFVKEHGHHTRGEYELSNPRWSERPDYILGMVRSYLNDMGKVDPVKSHVQRAKESNELAEKCRATLRNPLKRSLFNLFLGQTQGWSKMRENFKSAAMRHFTMMRFLLIEMGRRFEKRNILDHADDIFFLTIEEVPKINKEKPGFDVKAVIESRKSEYQRNLKVVPPKVIVGRFNPDNFIPDSGVEQDDKLQGLAVSPGVAMGPARVILDLKPGDQVLPGEILVAPFTDPGWTPYFMPASGIVMDQGGILSHGSIVAREYGIPAVVNVGSATRIIKTGQIIQVDGNKGIVRILSKS